MAAQSNDIVISAVEGNSQWLDGGAMFGNAPRTVWEKWQSPDEQGRIKLACRALLIESGPVKILCETGIGCFFEPKLAERYGVYQRHHILQESLKALNLSERDISHVILSHLHFDHAGGLLPSYEDIEQGNDQLLFSNAQYFVSKIAWQRCLKPHFRDRASYIPQLADKLQKTNRLVIIDQDRFDHIPGLFGNKIKIIITNGHTPGQMHVLCKGKHHSVFFAGDLIPGISWVHLPITMGYDRFPEQLIDEKQRVYDEAVPNHWLVFYTHDAKYPASFIENVAGRFQASQPVSTLARFIL